MRSVRLVAACETLAEQFEQAGRLDLATLCDRAAFWLEGGPRIDHMSLEQVVDACREAIVTEQPEPARLTDQIRQNLARISALAGRSDTAAIETAARLRAVAVLTEKLFR
jgi:hypothetical protein